jgi:hypothetical protein
MLRMVLILVLTTLAMFFLARSLEAPAAETRLGAAIERLMAPAPLSPPLMYAGIRG